MIGTIFDPGYLAVLLVLWLILDVYQHREITLRSVLASIAIALTFARSGYIVFFLGLLYMSLKLRRWLKSIVLALVLAGVIWFAPKPGGEGVNLTRTYSIVSRAESSIHAVEIFLEHPLVGIGFNAYPLFLDDESPISLPKHPSGPDTSIAHVLATAGMVGIVVFLVSLIWLWLLLDGDVLGRATLLIIVSHSLTNNTFFYPFTTIWLMGVLMREIRA